MIIKQIGWSSPHEMLRSFATAGTHLLHGGQIAGHASWDSGWSYLVTEPVEKIRVLGDTVMLDDRAVSENPFQLLRSRLNARQHTHQCEEAKSWPIKDLPCPNFLTGAVGYLSYEMAAFCRPPLPAFAGARPAPDMCFDFYDAAILFHRARRRCFVVARTRKAFDALADHIKARPNQKEINLEPTSTTIATSKQAYTRQVAAIINHIREGDIFQANLTVPVKAEFKGIKNVSLLARQLFARQSRISDAPYGALLSYGDFAVVSNAPERFMSVKKEGDRWRVICEPIKGTSARFEDSEKDRASAKSLYVSEKDRAENIMIVDLLRNDLSKSCEDHSIQEPQLCALKSFRRVHHLVSRIEGILKKDACAITALEQAFPCGSITGAPKERAMEIIAEKEARARSVYCGAIGFLDDRGGASFNVPIRTALLTRRDDGVRAVYGTGGGITLLSNAEEEFDELLLKAKGFRDLCEDTR